MSESENSKLAAQITELFSEISNKIRTFGECVNRAQSDWGADVWELNGVSYLMGSAGYYQSITTSNFKIQTAQNYLTLESSVSLEEQVEFLNKIIKCLSVGKGGASWKTDFMSDADWLAYFIDKNPAEHILEL